MKESFRRNVGEMFSGFASELLLNKPVETDFGSNDCNHYKVFVKILMIQ